MSDVQPKLSDEWRELLSCIPFDSEATADPGAYFDPEIAQLYLSFIEEVLVFVEGEKAGQPFVLEDWQAAFVANLFGWRRADGRRRFVQGLLYIPRKNGKTALASAILLAVAFLDGEAGGQYYSIAADREQSALIYRAAVAFIEREPELSQRSRVFRSFKAIEFPNGSIYKALSSDAGTKHGLSAHLILADEIHAMPDSELYDTLTTSQGARREPLSLALTTADFDRPSLCNSQLDYAKRVRDGEIHDPGFLPCIYETPQDADWTSEEVWRACNPNLGVSVSLEFLRRECKKAIETPSFEATFRRLYLCQKTSTASAWLKLHEWDACKREPIDLTGRECYGGLDLSTTTDVSAFVLAFPVQDIVWLLPFFWIPARKLREDKADRVPYELWARQGLVTVTPGDVIDYDRIRADIVTLGQKYAIKEIRFDPWNSSQIVTQLAEQDGFVMTQLRQGFVSLNAPSKELERRIVGRTLAHDGNAVLRWMAGNTSIETDAAGNIKPSKKKSPHRIDGIAAAVSAISGVMANPVIDYNALYKDGLLTL